MQLPPADLKWFSEQLTETATAILSAWQHRESSDRDTALPSSGLLFSSLQRLIVVLNLYPTDPDKTASQAKTLASGIDAGKLGEIGLKMLIELSAVAVELQLAHENEQLEKLALALALWIIEENGELSSIELVVNAIARLANGTLEQQDLERLFLVMGKVLNAAVDHEENECQEQLQNPRHLLLINRAIVATRALEPAMMEQAFLEVAKQLPEAAPGFFKEGMEQVSVQNYPEEVGAVIERFYLSHPSAVTLH